MSKPDSTPNPNASPPASEQPTGADALAKALTSLAESNRQIVERLAALETRPAPVAVPPPAVSQTPEQAIDATTKLAQDRRQAATSPDEHARIIAEYTEKLAQHEAELEHLRTTVDLRKSSYSLPEMTERLTAAAGVPRAETKGFYSRLATKHADSKSWHAQFGDMKPIDVLIRGAHEPRPITYAMGGLKYSAMTMAPVTAGAHDEVLNDAQDASDVLFTWMLWKQGRGDHYTSVRESPHFARFEAAMNLLGKASMTGTSLANWVPTGFSAKLVERMELERNLTRFLPFHLMTQNPEYLSHRGAYMTVYKVTPSTTDPEDAGGITTSAINVGRTTLELHNFAIRAVFDISAEEDTLPSLVPNLILDLGRSWAYSLEDAILNSDSTVFPHQDTDITATDDYRKTWDGLRIMAIDNSYTTSLATFTDTTVISTAVAPMGRYGSMPMRRICVVGPKVRAVLKTLKTAGNDPVIIGSASPGPIPSAVTGVNMEMLDGSPLVVVESARENLNATGFYDGTTTTNGNLMWVYPEGFALAAMNQVGRTVTNFETKTAQHEILLYQRYEFEDTLAIASNRTVNLGVAVAV